jgi:hypothetical protein
LVHEYIETQKREDKLVNNRLIYGLVMHAFLFTAEAVVVQAVNGIESSREPDYSLNTLRFGLPAVGIVAGCCILYIINPPMKSRWLCAKKIESSERIVVEHRSVLMNRHINQEEIAEFVVIELGASDAKTVHRVNMGLRTILLTFVLMWVSLLAAVGKDSEL